MRQVLVQGNFDVLHPGHIRLLKFAKECGDQLIVAINTDSAMKTKSRVTQEHRLEMVKSLECVDEAFLTSTTPEHLISELKPYAVVKGKEFDEQCNPEKAALDAYGGLLIFGSGEFESNAYQFINKNLNSHSAFDFQEMQTFAHRHDITRESVFEYLNKIQDISALVIGEVIVDEYVQGNAVGLSQEDPTIVMTPNKTDSFLGGAAITAGHIKSLGAEQVALVSVLGEDDTAKYVKESIKNYQVSPLLFTDSSRPTPLKTRFRAGSKTLLRVNKVRQHKISKELQQKILSTIEDKLDKFNLLVFSDFNYGILPQSLVEKLMLLCKKRGVKVVADSQTSSQVGDISRYKDTQLLTPTEREVRVSLNNFDDGLVTLAHKLTQKTQANYVVITLAEEGIFIHNPDKTSTNWENDRLPAINPNAIDPAGAGDCFLAASALLLVSGSDIWHACYVANLAAACQVNTIGNNPLPFSKLSLCVNESFE
jgi:rfaE bifunctional protein kinase chain/domain